MLSEGNLFCAARQSSTLEGVIGDGWTKGRFSCTDGNDCDRDCECDCRSERRNDS